MKQEIITVEGVNYKRIGRRAAVNKLNNGETIYTNMGVDGIGHVVPVSDINMWSYVENRTPLYGYKVAKALKYYEKL